MIERDQAGCTNYIESSAYKTCNPHNANPRRPQEDIKMHLEKLLAIALGGAIGALSRYAVVVASMKLLGDRFPYGVLVANVVGCFIIGLLMHEAIVEGRWLPATGHAALTIGFLGALTTFSSFGYDTVSLWELGRPLAAAVNVVANCVLGIGACFVGNMVGTLLAETAR